MQALILLFVWCILLVVSWPIALLALVLLPLFWLISLPLVLMGRLIGVTFDAVFALNRAVLFLPAGRFGYRTRA